MSIKQRIEAKIRSVLQPQHFEVENESGNHAVPPGSETHFKVLIVSAAFLGKSLLDRHRMIYALVEEERASGVHALALHTYTPEEWLAYQPNRKSPPCLGGTKKNPNGT